MSNRIPAGELGTITTRQRGGSWTAQANGRDLGGLKQTVYGTGFTEKEARKAVKRVWDATTQGSGRTLSKRSTIADATAVWLSEREASVSEQSMQVYRNRALNLTLGRGERGSDGKVTRRSGGVGEMQLRKVTLGWVRREAFRVKVEHGNAAAWESYGALHAVMHTAAVHEAVPTNPAAGAISTRDLPTKRDVHALSTSQFAEVWSALEAWGQGQPSFRVDKERLLFLLRLGLLTASRCGEALAVRESDVREDRVILSGTIVQPPKGPAFRQDWTKTKRRREVRMTAALKALLDARRATMKPNPAGLLVASRSGSPVPVVNVGRTLRTFAAAHPDLFESIGFPAEEFTFHVLRRTAATYIRERMGAEAAGSMLGHTGTGNLKHYADAPAMVNEDATELLSDLLC